MSQRLHIRMTSEASFVVKDVEAQLLEHHMSRRKAGTTVYPVNYTNELLDYDNWTYLFLERCRGPTLINFATHPSMVLDLGCGGGLWAITVSTLWKDATIYGLDLNNIQPHSEAMESVHPGTSTRVKWVQGNFLDGLPFESNYFDFVRIAGIGLGVPEVEWPNILEEVARVLKPGCGLEIIEEDPIFPCGLPPKCQSSPCAISDFQLLSPNPRMAETEPRRTQRRRTLTERISLQDIAAPQITLTSPALDSTNLRQSVDASRDHSKLKACWDSMLASRLIASQLVNVLPLYLSSSFCNIQSHPPLLIPLPPNTCALSGDRHLRGSNDTFDVSRVFTLRPHNEWASFGGALEDSTQPSEPAALWAPMHLAKSVQTVRACKEVLWAEWEHLYAGRRNPHNPVQTGRLEDLFTVTRDEFDQAWLNWETDMMDRINAKSVTAAEVSWCETIDDPQGSQPDTQETRTSYITTSSPEICRIIRGFVCWKAS